MRICNICKEERELAHHRRACYRCLSRQRRARAKEKQDAQVDPGAHDYQDNKLPPGYVIKGVSHATRDEDGNIKWIKSDKTKGQQLEDFMEALELTLEKIPRAPKVAKPTRVLTSDLINILPIGDAHVGLMTWWRETGESFDLKTAEQMYRRALDMAISTAPPAETLLIANVGDYFHSDGGKNQTTKGTPVDVDSRWAKIFSAGIEILCHAVDRGLETHKNVHLICAAGNHDAEAAVALSACLRKFYSRNLRVTVDEGISKFHYYRHGEVLLGITHGDTVKLADLPLLMATDRQEDWGATRFRHWYTGHVHHESVKDFPGCTVESVRVLVPPDAWHHAQGYRSQRDIRLVTWHKTLGRRSQNIFGIDCIME